MEEKQSDLNEEIEHCIKRYEELEKELRQPWRKCGEDEKGKIHENIKKLNDLFRKVESGKLENEKAENVLGVWNAIANSMDAELEYQNLQKSLGKEITPFGQMKMA